jgi:SAM-dependent methyltransferase
MAEFDPYAREYQAALAQGLSVTGENSAYFAHHRIRWLRQCLQSGRLAARTVLDYGCGTGSSTPWLLAELEPDRVIGVDVSTASLEEAIEHHSSNRVTFFTLKEFRPAADIDLAFCNGVFHHIPPPERALAVEFVARTLRPGGLFSFWENNPWNPGTRYVMRRIPFDRNAIPVTPSLAKRLLRAVGFEVLRTDFLFIFPRALRRLRWLEPAVCKLPLGGQYQILCRKPRDAA